MQEIHPTAVISPDAVIGSDVSIGAYTVIGHDVVIGDGCVIGAGSVVTKDIPANSIAVGVPARVLRQLTEADSMVNFPDRIGGCRPME